MKVLISKVQQEVISVYDDNEFVFVDGEKVVDKNGAKFGLNNTNTVLYHSVNDVPTDLTSEKYFFNGNMFFKAPV